MQISRIPTPVSFPRTKNANYRANNLIQEGLQNPKVYTTANVNS